MNNPVGWFEIYVADMARAKAFYEAVFGVELAELESPGIEMWAFSMLPEKEGGVLLVPALADIRAGGFLAHCDEAVLLDDLAGIAVATGVRCPYPDPVRLRQRQHIWPVDLFRMTRAYLVVGDSIDQDDHV